MARVDFERFDLKTASLDGTLNVPDSIFHYCSIDSACAILKSDEFWATRFCSTNDDSEFNYGYDLLKREMCEGRYFRSSASRNKILRDLFPRIENFNSPNPFIASFTSKFNSLAHWREYAEDASGVMLELNSNHFRSNLAAYGNKGPFVNKIFLQRVVYDEDLQKGFVSQYCRLLCPLLESLFNDLPTAHAERETQLYYDLPLIAGRIYKFCTALKHPSFEYEEEIRLSLILLTARNQKEHAIFGIREAYSIARPGTPKPFFKIFHCVTNPLPINLTNVPPPQEMKKQLACPRVGLGTGASSKDRDQIERTLGESNRNKTTLFQSQLPYKSARKVK
jgi:Protein of unknown function (DUF2971)